MRKATTLPTTMSGTENPKARSQARIIGNLHAAPSHDDIARRAFEIYINNGRKQNQDQQDWLQAERELRKQSMTAGKPRVS